MPSISRGWRDLVEALGGANLTKEMTAMREAARKLNGACDDKTPEERVRSVVDDPHKPHDIHKAARRG